MGVFPLGHCSVRSFTLRYESARTLPYHTRFPSRGHTPPHVTLLSTPSLFLFLPSGLSVREQRLGAHPCHPPTKPTCVCETCWIPGMPGNTLKVGQPQQEKQLLFPGRGPVCDRAGRTVVASEAPTVAVCPHPSTSDYSPRLTKSPCQGK